MPKYHKKPVIIEARQWDGSAEQATPIIDWALDADATINYYCGIECRSDTHVLLVSTLEGATTAQPGDYIIKGVKGEFYPCKLDIFEATYELVDTKDGNDA